MMITLTTDFGAGSPYVAVMKGVILRQNPAATLVDLTHAIAPQDVRQGALVLAETLPWFPPGTIHVAVIDPGVGSARRLIFAELGGQRFVGPDNGLISRLALRFTPSTIRQITEPRFWLPDVSCTFHGRDIMAPVAAALSLGLDPEELGPAVDGYVRLEWPEAAVGAGKISGTIESIDSFGNLISNITKEKLAAVPTGVEVRVLCDEHETLGIYQTYADQPEMTFVALVGSGGKLELAIVGESAAAMLGIQVGTPVEVQWT